jgi:hypothetical protein
MMEKADGTGNARTKGGARCSPMIEYIKTLEAQQGTGTWQQKTQDER